MKKIQEHIRSLLERDIFLSNALVEKILGTMSEIPAEDLFNILLILQNGSSKKEEILTKLYLKDPSIEKNFMQFVDNLTK